MYGRPSDDKFSGDTVLSYLSTVKLSKDVLDPLMTWPVPSSSQSLILSAKADVADSINVEAIKKFFIKVTLILWLLTVIH